MKIIFKQGGSYRITSKAVAHVGRGDVDKTAYDAESARAEEFIKAGKAKRYEQPKAQQSGQMSDAVKAEIKKINGLSQKKAAELFAEAGADTEEKQLAMLSDMADQQ